jgi:hypothetical protein
LALALLGVGSARARADVGMKIIERCTHAESLSGFSQQAYRRALQEMPTEVEEYSDCAELIHKAQLASAAGSAPAAQAAASSAAIPTTPAEQRAIRQAHRSGATPLQVGNGIVKPGVVHANIASAVNALPNPLLAVLALLLACATTVGARAIKDRVRDRND